MWLNLFKLGIQLQHCAIHTGIVWVSAEVHEFQTPQSNFPFDTAAGDQLEILSLVLSFYCLWRVNSLPHEISHIPPCSMKFRTYHRAPEITHIPPCSSNLAHGTVLHTYGRASQKKRTLCFLGWILWRMNVGGEWGIQEFRCIYAVFCEITYTTVLRTVFDQNQKNKSSLGFCWRMVASVGKYWASTLNITLFVALNCAWWKRSKRDPKEIQIQSCSTHTTVLHTYDRAPHIRPCSTKGVLPEIFWGTFKLAFFLGSGDRCIRWKWDGTYCWLELSSNNFGEFRKQFCIKFGLKHGQLWGLAIFRLEFHCVHVLFQLKWLVAQ